MKFMEIYLNRKNMEHVDLVKIRSYLENLPFTLQDGNNNDVYVLCGSEESKKFGASEINKLQKKMGLGNYPYGICIIRLSNIGISIGIGARGEDLAELKKFLNWIMSEYDFEVTDDYAVNWTEKINKEGVDVLFK